jgi:hypothetical protein
MMGGINKERKVITDGSAEKGQTKKVEEGGNWIVRLNLLAPSC